MSRWIVTTGFVSAASSAASVFVTSGFPRITLVSIAALSALLLAYFGARSEARVEEAHRRIIELDEELALTAMEANAAHLIASRPVRDRQMEEDYKTFVQPTEESVGRFWRALVSFFTGEPSRAP